MPSLSTTYGVSILLASIAGIGSAFLANKFVPMGPEPAEVVKQSSTMPQEISVDIENLSETLQKEEGINKDDADDIVELIKEEIEDWKNNPNGEPTSEEFQKLSRKLQRKVDMNVDVANFIARRAQRDSMRWNKINSSSTKPFYSASQTPAPSAPPEVPSKVAYEELPPAELPNSVPSVPGESN
jgi:cell fate (sporulation/competence/biofilm development) regulator YlbF (YheA/YmcA/DUF963 family)